MHALLEFLHGKKATFIAIGFLFVVFWVKEGIINNNMAELLSGILTVLGAGADLATRKYFGIERKKV